MHSIRHALANARQLLTSASHTPQLDAELLLLHCLKKPKPFLYHHDQLSLTQTQRNTFEQLLNRRIRGEPIAYIRGTTEFFSLQLHLTGDTLIPRPETEALVDWTLNQFSKEDTSVTIAELGTGSGAIALAIAKNRPKWKIFATESSKNALQVAQQNAKHLSIHNIAFHLNTNKMHWCSTVLNTSFSAIIANPPYIDAYDTDISSSVIRYEPADALFSMDQGLADLKKIISEAYPYLKQHGFLVLEHGYQQAKAVQDWMHKHQYTHIKTYKDLAMHDRMTIGQKYV
jgi:release factor glutamine methyltransferase